MNEWVVQLFIGVYLVGLVWLSVKKATEDGFYASLCTFVALLVAFRVADGEWQVIERVLRENLDVNEAVSVSAAYWAAFLVVIAPSMLFLKIALRERTPFPAPVEKYGSMLAGGAAGTVIFVTTVRWVFLFETVQAALGGAINPFLPFIELLR